MSQGKAVCGKFDYLMSFWNTLARMHTHTHARARAHTHRTWRRSCSTWPPAVALSA